MRDGIVIVQRVQDHDMATIQPCIERVTAASKIMRNLLFCQAHHIGTTLFKLDSIKQMQRAVYFCMMLFKSG